MHTELFENIGLGTLATNGKFFSQYVFKHLPLSNGFQIVTAINPTIIFIIF